MKIVYLLSWELGSDSGVSTKVQSQVEEWRKHGNEVEVWTVSHMSPDSLMEGHRVFEYPLLAWIPSFGLRKFVGKTLAYYRLSKEMLEHSPDLIYFRQSSWFPTLATTLASVPTVMEINTDDLAEIRHRGRLYKSIYMFGRERILKAVRGFVSMTAELGELFRDRGKPVQVVGNGIKPCPRPPAKESHERPQLIFVGSPSLYWHGTDKLVTLARLCPQYDFHVVGPELEDVPGNVIVHGYLDQERLAALYRTVDIGIGTLAVHRNNLREACPLKVREYLANALPVIIGYSDTDLSPSDEGVLELAHQEDNVVVGLDEIRAFVDKYWMSQIGEEIRERVFVSNKELKRLRFFELIIEKSSSKSP